MNNRHRRVERLKKQEIKQPVSQPIKEVFMDKQELIKKIDLQTFAYPDEPPEDCFEPTIAYKKGFNSCAEGVINLIEKLDEPTHDKCYEKMADYEKQISDLERQIEEMEDRKPKKVKVPELPSKIAKYLEWAKEEQFDFTEDYNMISWEHLRKFGGDDTEYLQMWFFDNDQKENERRHILFLQAYTDGYEVEKEPLFYIRLTIPSSSVVGLYLGFNKDGIFDHSYGKPHVTWDWKCTFTEKEIKSIDERYWAFAVPVKEVVEG